MVERIKDYRTPSKNDFGFGKKPTAGSFLSIFSFFDSKSKHKDEAEKKKKEGRKL